MIKIQCANRHDTKYEICEFFAYDRKTSFELWTNDIGEGKLYFDVTKSRILSKIEQNGWTHSVYIGINPVISWIEELWSPFE